MNYVKSGNSYFHNDPTFSHQFDKLPPGNYVAKFHPQKGYYLDAVEGFPTPEKVYGDVIKTAERILTTYEDRTQSTGVILSGEKGSGKTLTAKMISIIGAAKGYPTVIVNSPHCGETFNQFMQNISQECIVFFDEFEKVYNGNPDDRTQQEQLLTLFDGVYPQKKLFLMTCNDKYKVDYHMTNRPGRIFYCLEYNGLDPVFVEEYSQEKLKNKEHVEAVLRFAGLFEKFNFDMLKALIEEMNRYYESPMEAVRFLNTKPDTQYRQTFKVALLVDGVAPKNLMDEHLNVNPLSSAGFHIEVAPDPNDEDGEYATYSFSSKDLKMVDGFAGQYTYVKENVKLTLTRPKGDDFDFRAHYANAYGNT